MQAFFQIGKSQSDLIFLQDMEIKYIGSEARKRLSTQGKILNRRNLYNIDYQIRVMTE